MEWFKMQTGWGDAIQMLTDEEAGRVIKNIYAYILTGEIRKGTGREDVLMAMALKYMEREIEKYRNADAEEKRRKERRKMRALRAADARWNRQDDICEGIPGHADACNKHTDACYKHTDACNKHNKHQQACHNKNIEYKNTETKNPEERKKDRCTEAEKGKEEYYYCSELPPAVSELPVAEIPLNDGSEYPLYRKDVDEYAALYPAVDIQQELRNMKGWCQANPTRRKTSRGIRKFINGWLMKAQDRGHSGMQQERPENPFLKFATGEADIGDYLL